ncbi:MAG: alpha/beta hydrolase [Firmicutes bacterium]|nr:alpha/beta hydrolase [Bacillota bacterium]
MSRIEVNGISIFYAGRVIPHRPVLLFCHGAGGSHRHWLHQVEGLQEQAATLAVDLPGHGASEGTAAPEIAVYREFIRDFSAALGLKSLILAGHSMGGAIALDYALHYGESVKGLILVGSGARLRVAPPFLELCRAGTVPPELIDFAYSPAAPAKLLEEARQEMAAVPPQSYLADFTACNSFDCMEKLSQIRQPVLLLCGEADLMTPPRYSRYLKEQLAQAALIEVKGAGHMAMLEAPQQVNEAIASFLEKIGSG